METKRIHVEEIASLKAEIKLLKQGRNSNNGMFRPNNRNLSRSGRQSICNLCQRVGYTARSVVKTIKQTCRGITAN